MRVVLLLFRKVISVKGKKQVGSTASQEWSELTTIVCAINASGGSIPPYFIFKQKNMKDTFLINTPPQSAVFVSLCVCKPFHDHTIQACQPFD